MADAEIVGGNERIKDPHDFTFTDRCLQRSM